MTVALTRSYSGYAAGTITEFPASTEAALIAQGLAQASVAAASIGPLTSNEFNGTISINTGALSAVVNHPLVTPNSKIAAQVDQAAADGTLLYVARVVPASGSFTIYGNANATAPTVVDWAILSTGLTPNQ